MKVEPSTNPFSGKACGYTVSWPVPGGGTAVVSLTPEQAAQHATADVATLRQRLADADLAETYARVKHLLPESAFLSCCDLHIDRFERLIVQELRRRGEVKTIKQGEAKLAELVTFQRANPTKSIRRF